MVEVILLVFIIGGVSILSFITKVVLVPKLKRLNNESRRFESYFEMYVRWLELKNEGISIDKYLLDSGYKIIAIYGFGRNGKALYSDLKNSSVVIKYAIDLNKDNLFSEIPIVTPEEKLSSVDAIVVTPIFDYENIKSILENKIDCPILSMDDLIYWS